MYSIDIDPLVLTELLFSSLVADDRKLRLCTLIGPDLGK